MTQNIYFVDRNNNKNKLKSPVFMAFAVNKILRKCCDKTHEKISFNKCSSFE